ncbi:MAG: 4-amino-4-deoxy-L-arabinose transferase [Dehalococcoidales bacterium]|nr:4-amino-4-deoxy-L-arabinose transferase [Dehalococcoidales bacterium]
MFALALVLLVVLGTAIGQIVMKSGMSQVETINNVGQLFNPVTLFHIFTNPRVLIGVFCYVLSLVLWLGALSTLNVSQVYPLMSLSYVITAIFAFAFLKESMTIFNWVGILLVLVGCFLITRVR